MAAVALSACRGDAVSGPMLSSCAGATTCAPVVLVAGPEVYDALLDITDRLVPTVQLGGARADIRTPLARLEKALRQADASAGRLALAETYAALDNAIAAKALDGSDASAVRLALVPAARTLGVLGGTSTVVSS